VVKGVALDLTGQQFGRWTVEKKSDERRSGMVMWWCRCECGVPRLVQARNLTSGRSRGCRDCYLADVRKWTAKREKDMDNGKVGTAFSIEGARTGYLELDPAELPRVGETLYFNGSDTQGFPLGEPFTVTNVAREYYLGGDDEDSLENVYVTLAPVGVKRP
jgi:hypothetical protein